MLGVLAAVGVCAFGDAGVSASAALDPGAIPNVAFPLATFGRFSPAKGQWVEYQMVAHGASKSQTIRVASIGKSVVRGETLEQVEVLASGEKEILTVFWVKRAAGEPDRLRRVALWVKPNAALAVPLDQAFSSDSDRGEPTGASVSRQLSIPLGKISTELSEFKAKKGTSRVWISDAVPVFSVAKLDLPGETWTAVRLGTGAETGLTVVPMTVPRVSGANEK